MRIALCLSGQPRNIDKGFATIKKLLSDNTDVFIHTWYDHDKIGKPFENRSNTSNEQIYLEPDTIDKIHNYYKPKKVVYEKQYDCNEFIQRDYFANGRESLNTPFASFSQYLSIYRANELKKKYELENDFVYDLVIRCRFDISIDFEPMYETYQNKLYFSNYHGNQDAFDDLFWLGKSSEMDTVCESYKLFDRVFDQYNVPSWCNERLLYFVVMDQKINFEKCDKIKTKILR